MHLSQMPSLETKFVIVGEFISNAGKLESPPSMYSEIQGLEY